MPKYLKINLLSHSVGKENYHRQFYMICGLCLALSLGLVFSVYGYVQTKIVSIKESNHLIYQELMHHQQQSLVLNSMEQGWSARLVLMHLNETTPAGIEIDEIIYDETNHRYWVRGKVAASEMLDEWLQRDWQAFSQIQIHESDSRFELSFSKKEEHQGDAP